MIRWIAFDAVGTLIDPEPNVATAYATIGRQYGSSLTPAEVGPLFRKAFAESVTTCLPREGDAIVTNETLESARWQWIVRTVLPDVIDFEGCFTDLYDHFARPDHWRLFSDVPKTLAKLRQAGFSLAIASNFDQRLHRVCAGFPELQRIEQLVVSTEVQCCKPSPRFYERLLERCHCQPGELLMVGDDFEADVNGPQRLGIAARQINRQSQVSQGSTLASLEHLLEEVLSETDLSPARQQSR